MGRKVIRVATAGGFGDVLLSTPVYRALKETHRESQIVVYCRDKREIALLRRNPYIDRLWTVPFFFLLHRYILYYLRLRGYRQMHYGQYASLFSGKKAADAMAANMGVSLADRSIEIYLTRREKEKAEKWLAAYKNPILIHGCAATSANKNWSRVNWEALIREMPEYTFIQLGLSREEKLTGAVDLRGRTSLRESIALIRSCLCFIGVDSSLSHATNAFDIAGVVLFGPSTPLVWGHANNINLYKAVRCSPCIDLLKGSRCPYGKECMLHISVQEVKQAVLYQVKKKQEASI